MSMLSLGGSGGAAPCIECERVIFVTSTAYQGSLGGLAGADIKCNGAISLGSPRVQGRTFKTGCASKNSRDAAATFPRAPATALTHGVWLRQQFCLVRRATLIE